MLRTQLPWSRMQSLFFHWRFSDGASLFSVMLWSRKRLLWMLSDSQSAFFSTCFVHMTSTHDYHVYNQLPDADSPRVLGTYPSCFDLYSLFVQFPFRLEFNEPFPFLALWSPFFHPSPSSILVLPPDHYLAGICLISLSLPLVLCQSSRLGSLKHLWT